MSAVDPQKASQGNSTNAFLTSLVTNSVLLAVEVGAFVVLKQKLWRIYTPRAYLPPPDKRATELPSGPWRWLPALLMSPPEEIIRKNGFDAYMFLRYIKLLIIIFVVFTFVTFAVIIPVDTVGIENGLEGVERTTWTNLVDPRQQHRHAAHIVIVWFLTAFVVYMIFREMGRFIRLRHQFLLSASHTKLAQSRTVLITAVPNELSTEQDMRMFASFVPGGVERVWMYRDSKELNHLFERRQEICKTLETAQAALLTRATKAWRKKQKLHLRTHGRHRDEESIQNSELEKPEPSMETLKELVPDNHRPKHRTGLFGLFGPRVNSIDWCKTEIAALNTMIKEKRKDHSEGKFLGSAFIRCNIPMGAHILSQCVSYHEPLKMCDKWMEAHPNDIVWNNLDDGGLEMRSRYVLSWAATIGLIMVWTFPVGFIGTLSNLSELCVKVSWLGWVCEASPVARGLVEGVLPPALLAVLFAVLPMILQALAWYECIPRYSLISVSVYRRFYLFLLVHGFLIVTISSGITNAIADIVEKPTQAIPELASKLPGASVFFLTYMVTQGLAGAGSALVQLVPLVMYFLKKWFLGQTPREAYSVTFMMPSADFGVVLPRLSLLATITFAYSVLSPLINLLALMSFGMFYLTWKFLLVQVFDQPDEAETGGMYFPMAMNNLFVGLYIEHLCLACLFFLKASDEGTGAIVKGAFMLVLLAATACAHAFISHCFSPLANYLPMSLATKKMTKRVKREQTQKEKLDTKDADDDGIDLFRRTRIQSVRRRIQKKIVALRSSEDAPDVPKESEEGASSSAPLAGTIIPDSPLDGIPELVRYKTNELEASKRSRSSKESTRGPKMVFDAPAPRVTIPNEADSDEDEEDQDVHAFDHPSTYQEQACIWIPKDVLGFSDLLARELQEVGVDASDVGAFMDERGIVEVKRNPPDEEWTGGHDA